MSATTATAIPSPQSPWPPILCTATSTTPIGLPQTTPPSVGQLGQSALTRSLVNSPSSPAQAQKGYFNLVVGTPTNNSSSPNSSNSRGRILSVSTDSISSSSHSATHEGFTNPETLSQLMPTSHLEVKAQTSHGFFQQTEWLCCSDSHATSSTQTQTNHQNLTIPGPSALFKLRDISSSLAQRRAANLCPNGSIRGNRADGAPILPKKQPFAKHIQQTQSLPASTAQDGVSFISGRLCADFLLSSTSSTLLIDVRPYPQFIKSRIRGAINLCVPTTLLKRPTFSLNKLEETLASGEDKKAFSNWKNTSRIIAYDATSTHLKDSLSLINILKKFKNEGFQGDTFILHGGFSRFTSEFSNCTEADDVCAPQKPSMMAKRLNLSLPKPTVIGGCPMPTKSNCPVNPFFSHIRQNIELTNGVGQIPINVPESMSGHERQLLPAWLRSVIMDNGKLASERFFEIEKAEQNRMREAYTGKQPTSPVKPSSAVEGFRIAGIEKGAKNRYKDIFPFDHSRVRLKQESHDSCDYVNASFIKASRSNRQYIATQAPIPSTFTDFWRLIWEQGVRAIVMLTAELEGFHVKCHPYWKSGNYGQFKVEELGQQVIPLEPESGWHPKSLPSSDGDGEKNQASIAESFPGLGTNEAKTPIAVIIRRLRVTADECSIQTVRDVVQVQFSGWPDFGRPTKPAHLLRLIDVCHSIFKETNTDGSAAADSEPVPPNQRNIVVHCSAGCGRTGTFCTIDSVIDMLKHQRASRGKPDQWTESSQWMYQDDIDLIAETVEEFRHQRLSMVQTLQQFVLCYESILEWIAGQEMRR